MIVFDILLKILGGFLVLAFLGVLLVCTVIPLIALFSINLGFGIAFLLGLIICWYIGDRMVSHDE